MILWGLDSIRSELYIDILLQGGDIWSYWFQALKKFSNPCSLPLFVSAGYMKMDLGLRHATV